MNAARRLFDEVVLQLQRADVRLAQSLAASRQSRFIAEGNLIAGGILVWVAWPYYTKASLAVFVVALILVVWPIVRSVWRFRHRPAPTTASPRRARSIIVYSGVMGVFWGASMALLLPALPNEWMNALLAGAAFMALMATAAVAVSPLACVSFIVPIAVASLGVALLRPTGDGIKLWPPLVCYYWTISWFLYSSWRRSVQVLDLTASNAKLVAVLEDDVRRQRRLLEKNEASEAALRASQSALAEQTRLLQSTLDNMDQGLLLVDASRRVAMYNRRFTELLDIPASLLDRHPPFTEVLDYQWAQGEFDQLDEEHKEEIRRGRMRTDTPFSERRRPNGIYIEFRSVVLPDGSVVRTYTDLTARRAAEERLQYMASHDGLTGLLNRSAFIDLLIKALSDEQPFAVLCMDLDHFKAVNDTRGHMAGDELLRMAAQRMRTTLRTEDNACRLGGDEFAIVVRADPVAADQMARRLQQVMSQPYDIDGVNSTVGVSVGLALYPGHGTTANELLHQADEALYVAKRAGRGAVVSASRFGAL